MPELAPALFQEEIEGAGNVYVSGQAPVSGTDSDVCDQFGGLCHPR
ncbi:hypothetical protein VAS14_22192 [Photobacterium angustum S14]|uniref:Uncharacterized protein n=1 Tax=Photobacterium angustum (strain S14 / CCUG 15956) TaxID=314292 RepID=Q1ZK20_PHOAS|nr:hypothetical protein VAS14_22192 [Photobacterium angustum S14]